MTKPGGYVAADVLTAANMNLLPGGVMGYARVTADQSSITTEVDLTSLTVTWTAVAARLYKMSFHVVLVNTDVAATQEVMRVKVTDGSNTMIFECPTSAPDGESAGIGGQFTFVGVGYQTGLSGSTTRKLRALTTTSGCRLEASSTSPAFFIVEDIGPA